MAAVFTVMNSLFTANAGMSDMMTTQQNVRVALNTIVRDITMAGTGLPASVGVPNDGAVSSAIIRPGMATFPVGEVTRNIFTPTFVLPMLSPGNDAGPSIGTRETDALTIFSVNQECALSAVEPCNPPLWNIAAGGITAFANRYEVVFPAPQNLTTGTWLLNVGDVLMFTNANTSVLGYVTLVDAVAANRKATFAIPDLMGINRADPLLGALASLRNPDLTYPPPTAVRVNIVNYYLDSVTIPAHPRLMRAVNGVAAPVIPVIAEDIENLQFSFDLYNVALDTTTTNQDDPAFPSQIRSVYITVSGRSAERLLRTKDYFRFSLLTKINVRNATFRDRYVGS
jgi:hypothetical protein